MRALSGERIEDISMTFGEELISGTGHGAAHELRSLDLELLAVELDKAAIKAEKLARLSVFRAVHEIELREDDGMAFDRTWSGAVRALFRARWSMHVARKGAEFPLSHERVHVSKTRPCYIHDMCVPVATTHRG